MGLWLLRALRVASDRAPRLHSRRAGAPWARARSASVTLRAWARRGGASADVCPFGVAPGVLAGLRRGWAGARWTGSPPTTGAAPRGTVKGIVWRVVVGTAVPLSSVGGPTGSATPTRVQARGGRAASAPWTIAQPTGVPWRPSSGP